PGPLHAYTESSLEQMDPTRLAQRRLLRRGPPSESMGRENEPDQGRAQGEDGPGAEAVQAERPPALPFLVGPQAGHDEPGQERGDDQVGDAEALAADERLREQQQAEAPGSHAERGVPEECEGRLSPHPAPE